MAKNTIFGKSSANSELHSFPLNVATGWIKLSLAFVQAIMVTRSLCLQKILRTRLCFPSGPTLFSFGLLLSWKPSKLAFISGNKIPARCNRGFYCRSYCLLNMFRSPLCPSSRAQEYYTVVAACGICCSILQTGHITLSSAPDQQFENHSTKYHRQQPLYNTLELLMMGIVVPETCWASNKIWRFISAY